MSEQPEASFLPIVYTMATQAMIALGEIPNPMTRIARLDERQARWHLSSLRILAAKTQGNLDDAETAAIENALAEIEKVYADKLG